MTTPTAPELALLRTQPQQTKLYLSIYEPQTVFQAQVNDGSIAKGETTITYDNVTFGNYLSIYPGMTLWVGSSAGARDKGTIWIYTVTSSIINIGENSHINWEDGDYLTVVNYHQIWPLYPQYTQDAEDITVYKLGYQLYVDQNEGTLGSFLVMGSNYAGFIDATTGTAQIYWDGSECDNVAGVTTGSAYEWSFDGGDPTGSTAVTPGWVTYDTPGHYQVRMNLTSPDGNFIDYGIRHVSIYDRPGVGPNTPILEWGINEFSGGRDEGGYTARLWVRQEVQNIIDGALVVIFSDDWYGDTQQSIGGNSPQRESIVFCGYIIGSSIDYDYRDSLVNFDVGSPTEIMKIGEAFSISVEDSNNPTSDASNRGGDPWFYFNGLTTKSALWHYYAFHSTIHTLMDIRYVGDEFDIQFFDADRTSLFDAGSTFMKSSAFGEMVCDRQGALYFEIGAEAIDGAGSSLNKSMFIDNHDWMGSPSITERPVEDVSHIEGGGVSYTSYRNGGDGSFAAMMGGAPGDTPAYRGVNQKISGLALTSQNQLNTLLGNVWENRNATYPDISLDLVGNFRNLDIAPQEIVTMTLDTSDTFRGISWEQKAFTPRSMSWQYDAKKGLLLPSVALREVTQGNAGQTISIPVTPPDGGYGQPPIPLPPPVPPIPTLPPISLGTTAPFVQVMAGYDYTAGTQIFVGETVFSISAGIGLDPTNSIEGTGAFVVGEDGTITITPLVRIDGASGGDVKMQAACYTVPAGTSGLSGQTDSDSIVNTAITLPSFSGSNPHWEVTDLNMTLDVSAGNVVIIFARRNGSDGGDNFTGYLDLRGWKIY